jgi:flagellar hook protein FlgE
MSILTAMYSGVSGLAAEGQALGVVGDNVANTSTVGFKQSRSVFADVLGGAAGTNALGGGVRFVKAQQLFAQGTILNTGQPTDLALSGDGFFVVQGTVDGQQGNYYTRAGQSALRADGTLVNPEGLAFLGYKANTDGTYQAASTPIVVPTAALPPKMTTKLTVTANLDSKATTPVAAWDPLNPSATSNYSTSMQVYDSLGTAHSIDIYMRNTGPGAWEYHALANGAEIAGGAAGTPSEIASGTLTFDTTGALSTSAISSGGTASFNGATPGQPLTFDFGTPTATGGTGLGGTTGFGSPSSVSSQGQDGYASGDLTGVKIDGDGTVNGTYSNGQRIPVAKLAIGKFRSNDGLGRAGHGLWIQTKESGDAALGAAGSGGRAAVVSGALEQSNADIAQQFVDLIAHQRAFQANSKTITTSDEMLNDIVNLKR